jgi:hypothetical protein
MLNIFYRDSHLQGRMSGPKKVIENLIRSLDDCKIDYSINREIYKNNFFLHWDDHHIEIYKTLKNRETLLVGPQFWPFGMDLNILSEYGKIVAPSKWVSDLFFKYFNLNNNLIWPVGIYAPDVNDNQTIDCLIYYKNRPAEHLEYVKSMLSNRRLTYIQLAYGSYSQQDFKQALSSVKFCIIIDNTESQGIAIQEMMAANKPLFVWDKVIWDHMGDQYLSSASSVPYWSSECGEKVIDSNELEFTFNFFIDNLKNYSPKDYVERELSPQKSIKIITDTFTLK